VRAGDLIARAVITLGGIGTIVAVLLVGVYLLTVALPLFRPARAVPGRAAVAGGRDPLRIGTDESGSVVWLLDGGDGTAGAGSVNVESVATGERLLVRSAADCGLKGWSALRTEPGGLLAAAGFDDGTFRTGRLGLESEFVAAADVPEAARGVPVGAAVAVEDVVYVRGANDRFGRVKLVAAMEPPAKSVGGRIVDIDIVPVGDGTLVAALDEAGRVRVEQRASKRNMMTGKVVVKATGATIDPVAGFRPRFVRVSGLGDQLFLLAADGSARRYVVRDVTQPQSMETFAAAPDGRGVATVERLFGGTTLAVADTAGDVRLFFTARRDDAAAADGLATVAARTFAARGDRVDAIAASPRSRLFAVADSRGDEAAGVRLLQATTGAEVLGLAAPAGATATRAICVSPRENRLVTATDRGVAAWSFDAGHADVSPRTLLTPVWYENYPRPVHAWETTGHEAFESKFGLVPLIFGTLKATLYSMLFATPIALLAAIYASQFMHPRWKARIKPTIEMMASLPSVVLGFVAGIVFAPAIEGGLMTVITGFFVVPLTLLVGAHLWQLLPVGTRSRLGGWRFPLVALGALPAGVLASRAAAPAVERILFDGDVQAWLDGRGGSGFGGWMVAFLPLAALAAAFLVGRLVHPALRRAATGWSQPRAAVASLGVFIGGVVLAGMLAAAAAVLCDSLRLDTRGGVFGTYVQRNALVVAIGMSFAIIPLIFTIADDALSSVPEHLRSASLGAGATPWQTAIRVIVPAAASGLFSAVMIGLGRAVGETMIVLMAAGNTPLIGWNVFNGFQTLSAAIATELPEAARGSTHYRVLFLAAVSLFALTFVLNTVAELVRQRFRRRAHDL
jgi:phosphate transport system permease protein